MLSSRCQRGGPLSGFAALRARLRSLKRFVASAPDNPRGDQRDRAERDVDRGTEGVLGRIGRARVRRGEHDHQPERDARHVRAEQIAQHQPRRLIEQQHHRRGARPASGSTTPSAIEGLLGPWASGTEIGRAFQLMGRDRGQHASRMRSQTAEIARRLNHAQRPTPNAQRPMPIRARDRCPPVLIKRITCSSRRGASGAEARVRDAGRVGSRAGRPGRRVGPRAGRPGHRADPRVGHDAGRGRVGGVDRLYL